MGTHNVTGGTSHRRYDSEVFTCQRVEQGGFTDVGLTNQHYRQAIVQ